MLKGEVKRARMEDSAEGNVHRLERINRYLMIGVIVLVIVVVLLALGDFA